VKSAEEYVVSKNKYSDKESDDVDEYNDEYSAIRESIES
jgi:hypothetical protein